MSWAVKNGLKVSKFIRIVGTDFREYLAMMLAIGAIPGFDNALENDLNITNIPTNMNRADNIKKQNLAWGYLTLILGGATAKVLDQVTSKNPYTAWASL